MTFLPITSDVQVLELIYSLKDLSNHHLCFSECSDISLGLIETNGLRAILSAQQSLCKAQDAVVTLRKLELFEKEDGNIVVNLEPLQSFALHFQKQHAVIEVMPLNLPARTPYYSLIQHLILGRLEVLLTEIDVFYLCIKAAAITESFAEVLRLRGYQLNQEAFGKYLLMTSTATPFL